MARYERSDVCAVPAAAVVAEAIKCRGEVYQGAGRCPNFRAGAEFGLMPALQRDEVHQAPFRQYSSHSKAMTRTNASAAHPPSHGHAARVSTGSVYHQFPDKETIFRTLLDQYWKAIEQPDFPFNRALAEGAAVVAC